MRSFFYRTDAGDSLEFPTLKDAVQDMLDHGIKDAQFYDHFTAVSESTGMVLKDELYYVQASIINQYLKFMKPRMIIAPPVHRVKEIRQVINQLDKLGNHIIVD